jgi:hypothetical protein
MTVYVLGAGASYHAGYPLANSMGSQLSSWMKKQSNAVGFESRYPATAEFLEEMFGPVDNIEDLFTKIQEVVTDWENGTPEQRAMRTAVANERGVLVNAVRSWFGEIRQQGVAGAYQLFARRIVSPGDCIVTFNYDVALDRELKLAGKFEVGDGYGFHIETLPLTSATRILKLHGSTNWLALMFKGITSGPFQFEPGNVLGQRPVVGKDEFAFLGYSDVADHLFPRGGAALPVMIMPTRSKEFFFAGSTGVEYTEFWDSLWRQASEAMKRADRLAICGYSMPSADQRARELLLNVARKDAEVVVASGGDTPNIVKQYSESGYSKVRAADEVLFEKWVDTSIRSATAVA